MEEAYNYGWPVVRHMMLVFPNHSNVYTENLGYQYMLGTELLVAPWYTRGDVAVEVWLPGNVTWVHVWTNSTYHQGREVSIKHCTSFSTVLVVSKNGRGRK